MSVELTVQGNSLVLDEWDEVLRDWAAALEEPLFEDACFVNEHAPLFGPGSIRGAALFVEGPALKVRMNALASRADWRMAYAVVRLGLERGRGVLEREDGQRLSVDDLTPERADQDAVADFCFASRAMQREGGMRLPIRAWSLVLREGELPICTDAAQVAAAEAPLAERVARYAAAYVPSVMVLQNDVRLTTWARIPSIIGRARLVAIEGLEQPVPLERVLALLGERAEDVGGLWYVPGLDADADADLLAALGREQVDIDRWADEHRAEVDADAAALSDAVHGPAGDPVAALRELARRLVDGVMSDQDPEEVRRGLLREGHSPETVDIVFMVLSRALQAFSGPAAPTPPDVLRALAAEGVPEPLAEAVLMALVEGAGA